MNQKFSVSMCVYGGDDPAFFDDAVGSIVNQTVQPSEIVLTVDGPIPQTIESVIEKYRTLLTESAIRFQVVYLEKNGSLSNVGVEKNQNNFQRVSGISRHSFSDQSKRVFFCEISGSFLHRNTRAKEYSFAKSPEVSYTVTGAFNDLCFVVAAFRIPIAPRVIQCV